MIKKYNLQYHSVFYIFKVKLVGTRMGYIFSFLPDGQTPRHNNISVLSCLLAHHQRLTTIFQNPGYDSLYRLTDSLILSGEIRDTPKDIAPNHIHLFKYAPLTSCEFERSFSLYKNIISDRRQNLTPENMEKYPNIMRHTVFVYVICVKLCILDYIKAFLKHFQSLFVILILHT
ncbi:hypothetical protein C0J52_04396 [Blattella germanica]|nr:hypothetical protein C0J52_04396 [Blattella germanica]